MKPKHTKSKANDHHLVVQNYSVRIYPGRSSKPAADISGKALGYVTLRGKGTEFTIQFLPDGSTLPLPLYNAHDDTVDLCMNWCQFEGLLRLLKHADSVHAHYFMDAGVPWADVEGEYGRPKKRGWRK